MFPIVVDRYYRTLMKKISRKYIVFLIIIGCSTLIYFTGVISEKIKNDAKEETRARTNPIYMLYGDNVDSGYLKHVTAVLERVGYQRARNTSHFDLLWSHVYPFGDRLPFSKVFLQNLEPYQKVNHVPGSGYFTNKVDLATSDLKHVPRAFHLPGQKEKVLEYARQNPNHLFVQKSNSHRGIKILKIKDMNLDKAGTFVQEYVRDPLLIDGLKFDVGIYTILTSVDPLRVYVYNSDVLLRFCPKKYEPFDPEDIDKYVVGDDYIPIWNVRSLKKSYKDLGFGMKESLNIYLRERGENPTKIWDQIEESIRTVFLKKESKIVQVAKRYRNNGNFFEMVRFDFVLDSKLNVYLMEANMSPNLSSEHFPPNRILYENVLFNLFSIVGVSTSTRSIRQRSSAEEEMEVPVKNLMVMGDECAEDKCQQCRPPYCILCKNCLTTKSLNDLRLAYLEHVNRKDCKRIFPPPLFIGICRDRNRFPSRAVPLCGKNQGCSSNIPRDYCRCISCLGDHTTSHGFTIILNMFQSRKISLEDMELDEYSPENRLMISWFLGKCHQDSSWCE